MFLPCVFSQTELGAADQPRFRLCARRIAAVEHRWPNSGLLKPRRIWNLLKMENCLSVPDTWAVKEHMLLSVLLMFQPILTRSILSIEQLAWELSAWFSWHSITKSCLSPSHSLPQKLDLIPEQSLKVYFTDQSKIRKTSVFYYI